MGGMVAGGYFLARRRAEAPALPGRFISLSDCLTDFVPDVWAIEWTTVDEGERRATAARFGFDEPRRAAVTAWSTAALEHELGFPNAFFSLESARTFRQRFLVTPNAALIGIALPEDLTGEFIDYTRPPPGHGAFGVPRIVAAGAPPVDGGAEVLGWAVVCCEVGGFHSYACNHLAPLFEERLGVRPNADGYFDEDAARRCAELAGREDVGAEPGLWLPWQVRIYA